MNRALTRVDANLSDVESTELTREEESSLRKMEKAYESKDSGFLIRLLESSPRSLILRVHATCMLEDAGHEEAVPVLCKILREDPSALTRHEAAFTLGQLGYPSALKALLEAMEKDPSPIVRHEAAVALSSIGDPQSIPFLEHATRDGDEEVRNSAIIAIKYLTFLERSRRAKGKPESKPPKIRL